MNEFRQDPVTGQWVIISAERDHRPNEFRQPSDAGSVIAANDGAETCPFCSHQMDTPPIISRFGSTAADDSWQVCVVPNRYPVLNLEVMSAATPRAAGLFKQSPAIGCHEVVIESPTHQVLAGDLTSSQYFFMLQAYRDRMLAMRGVPGIRYSLAIKNSGVDAGASIRHTHSQLFGLPMVPEQVQKELDGSIDYFETHQRCVYCDLVQTELASGQRIVAQSDDFVAWCPHASRFAYEVWLAPRNHQSRFEESDDQSLASLGGILRAIIGKLDQTSRIDAFNYLLHSQPFDTNHQDHYHWHIEILPRIAKQAGFEWGTGVHINTVAPVQSASELRLEP